MAKYGFGVYGIPKYGELEGNRLYYSSNIFGWAYDYQVVSLTWQSIVNDPEDIPYVPVRWKLIRSYSGVPDNPYVGEVLDSGVLPGDFRLTYLDDSAFLLTNQEVTYVLWVFTAEVNESNQILSYENSRWINCGSTSVNVVDQSYTQDQFKRWLPAAWLNEFLGTGDAIGEPEDGILTQTIEAYGFAYDKIKTDAVLLSNSSNPATIPSKLLRNKVTELGFLYEPSLGDTYHRSIYKTGNFINSVKGTASGISTYATALTHWGTSVGIGKNLMLDYNDSSFEESNGRWTNTVRGYLQTIYNSSTAHVGWTLSNQKYATSLADIGVAITPPTPGIYDDNFPPRASGFMRLAKGTTGPFDQYLTLAGRYSTSSSLYSVPIDPTKEYMFTGWVRSKNARAATIPLTPTLLVTLIYFDKNGNFVGSNQVTSVYEITNTWVSFASGTPVLVRGIEDVPPYQDIPLTAAYVGFELLIQGAVNNDEFLFDMFQFSELTNDYVYEDPRLIKLYIEGDVQNHTLNPSFDSGTSWWQGLNAEIVQDFNPPATAKVFGSAVAKVTAKSTDIAALISDWQVLTPGKGYLASAYVSGPVGRTAVLRLEYSAKQSYEEQGEILTDEEGSYYPLAPYYVDSDPLTLSANATRLFDFAVSPVRSDDFSSPLAKVSIYFPNAQANDVFYVDSVMLTEGTAIEDYFQGDGGVDPIDPNVNTFYPDSDCSWDKREQLNFVPNPSFVDTSKWVATAGTTLTTSTSNPLFGTTRGNVSASGGGEISTTVYYPAGACIGGEDVVVSAYVKNVAGTYSISTSGQTKNSFKISSSNASSWTRIDVNRIAEIGEESFTITISLTEAGSGVKVFHIDGVQAELGRVVTPFIDPANQRTITLDNPRRDLYGDKIYYAYSDMVNAGYSFYATRYLEKYERLLASLSLVTPLGSSYLASFERSATKLDEIPFSLLPASSFELNLKGWSGVNSSLKRAVSRGTLFDEILTQGASFCKITATSSSTFGIITDAVDVDAVTGYYTSIAVKPENEDAYGTYTLKLKWYADSGGLLREKVSTLNINRHDRWAYLDIVAPGNKTVSIVGASVSTNYITLTTAGEHKFSVGEDLIIVVNDQVNLSGPATIEAITPTTFSFTRPVANLPQTEVIGSAKFSNTGVSSAKIEVLCAPNTPGAGVTFHLDKVIFRE
jgi:hypothetical protein